MNEPVFAAASAQSPFLRRMIGAAMLDVNVYEEVEADRGATGQAAGVVALVAVSGAIGGINRGGAGVIVAVIAAFLGWAIWAAVTYVVGTKLFGGKADWGEMARTIGFAQSPGVLGFLAIIPILGVAVAIVIGIWQLVTGVVAIRQALDIDTGKAVITAVISAVLVWVVMFIPMAMLAATLGTVMR